MVIILFARVFPGTLFKIGQGIFYGTIRRIGGALRSPWLANYTKNDHQEPAPSGNNLALACRGVLRTPLFTAVGFSLDFPRISLDFPPFRRMLFGVQSNFTMNDHLGIGTLRGVPLSLPCRGCSPEHPYFLAWGFSPEQSLPYRGCSSEPLACQLYDE